MTPWVPDSKYMFGRKDEVREVRHLLGTAGGYGETASRMPSI